jgi:hypothetical protein
VAISIQAVSPESSLARTATSASVLMSPPG